MRGLVEARKPVTSVPQGRRFGWALYLVPRRHFLELLMRIGAGIRCTFLGSAIPIQHSKKCLMDDVFRYDAAAKHSATSLEKIAVDPEKSFPGAHRQQCGIDGSNPVKIDFTPGLIGRSEPTE